MTTPRSEPDSTNAEAPPDGSPVETDAPSAGPESSSVDAEPPLDCALAEKYRRRLTLLPREYRAVHGAEMLQVFLESARDADPENADLTYRLGSPGWRETSALVALALRLRWTAPADDSRFAARAAGLRLLTSAVVVLLAAMSVQQTVSAIALLVHPSADWETVSLGASMWQTLVPTDDWWRLTAGWVHLAWIAVMVLLGLGTRIALRVATVLAAVPTVVLAIGILSTVVQSGAYGIAGSIGWLAVDVSAVLGLAAVASYVRSAERAGVGLTGGAQGSRRERTAAVEDNVARAREPSSWPGEFTQPRRLKLHLAVTALATAPSVVYVIVATITRLPIAVYFIGIPLTDLPSFFSLAAVVAAAVALARRRLPPPFAYALAGLASAAAALQATGLDLWVILARSEFPAGDPFAPYARLCLVMAITALTLDVLIAAVAIAIARRARVRV